MSNDLPDPDPGAGDDYDELEEHSATVEGMPQSPQEVEDDTAE